MRRKYFRDLPALKSGMKERPCSPLLPRVKAEQQRKNNNANDVVPVKQFKPPCGSGKFLGVRPMIPSKAW